MGGWAHWTLQKRHNQTSLSLWLPVGSCKEHKYSCLHLVCEINQRATTVIIHVNECMLTLLVLKNYGAGNAQWIVACGELHALHMFRLVERTLVIAAALQAGDIFRVGMGEHGRSPRLPLLGRLGLGCDVLAKFLQDKGFSNGFACIRMAVYPF